MNGFNLYEDITELETLIEKKQDMARKLEVEITALTLLLHQLQDIYNKR